MIEKIIYTVIEKLPKDGNQVVVQGRRRPYS